MPSRPSQQIETFVNPASTPYVIDIRCPEFTCLCPKTGQPDFGVIRLRYVPDKRCVELKALKLYLWSFRNEGKFHEAVTHEIKDTLVRALAPKYLRVSGDFYVRGGIHTVVRAIHGALPKSLLHEPDPESAELTRTPGFS